MAFHSGVLLSPDRNPSPDVTLVCMDKEEKNQKIKILLPVNFLYFFLHILAKFQDSSDFTVAQVISQNGF